MCPTSSSALEEIRTTRAGLGGLKVPLSRGSITTSRYAPTSRFRVYTCNLGHPHEDVIAVVTYSWEHLVR